MLKKINYLNKFHNFIQKNNKLYPNNKMEILEFENTLSGSKYIHFKNDDDNKSFAVLIKTLLDDDTGKPHVLEHLSLCGSKKFPIRDPFFNMLNRSINSYMNAWTGTDFTMFPFSSLNNKDFNNLLKIYLDAVFQPNLDYFNFRQEGWRYIFDKNDKLEFSGVVYNEMKGDNDNRDSLIIDLIQKYIFEKSELGLNSGGIPKNILDLKYDDLKNYHKKYYIPSNAVFISYGKLDVNPIMDYIEDNYISNNDKDFNKNMNHKLIPKFSNLDFNRRENVYLKPLFKDNTKNSFIKVFVVNKNVNLESNSKENIALNIINQYLLKSPNSPLVKNIINKGLAGNFFNYNGYLNYLPENLFVIGFDYINEDKIETINQTLNDILTNLTFDEEELNSIFHQFELSNKIKSSNEGIRLYQSALPFLNYGSYNYLDSLFDISKIISEIKNDPNYLKNILNKYFVNNEKVLDLNIIPDSNFNEKVRKEEEFKLKEDFKKMDNKMKEEIREENKKIKELQELKEDQNILPKIEIKDINKNLKYSRIDKKVLNNVEVWGNEENLEDVIKITIKFNIFDLEESFFNHLYLFQLLFDKTGTKNIHHEEFLKKFKNKATKMNVYNTSIDNLNINKEFENYLVISYLCLKENLNDSLNLLSELLIEPEFEDKENYSKLIKMISSKNSDNIVNDPFDYLFDVSSKKFSLAKQKINSFDSNKFLVNYGKNYEKSNYKKEYLEDLSFNFELILNKVLKEKRMKIMYHCSDIDENKNYIEDKINNFIDKLKTKKSFNEDISFKKHDFNLENIENLRYLSLPQEINYVCKTFKSPNLKSKDHAVLRLVGSILSGKYLHNLIREKGGAYGSGVKFINNTMNFFSYRDPNTLKTINNFEESINNIVEGNFNQEDIDGGKLRLLSSFDSPVSPQSKNIDEFLFNIKTKDREEYRLNIINSTKDELLKVSNEYLKNKESSILIFGSNKNNLDELKNYEKLSL